MAEATHQFSALASSHPHLVVCAVADEHALLEADRILRARGIRCTVFREPDLGNRPTALAAEPVAGAARRPFRRFPLLRLQSIHPGGADFHGGSRPAPEPVRR